MFSSAWDRVGVALSAVCAVHCVATPLAVGALAASGMMWMGEGPTEGLLQAGALVLGLGGLRSSFRHHGRFDALALFVAGLAVLVASQALHQHGVVPVLGSMLLVAAHARSLQHMRRCRHVR